jgi:predicted transcriptional regulator of viral defense system
MRTTEAYARLLEWRVPVVTTHEAAARLGIPLYAATRLLRRLTSDRLVVKLRRGLWVLDLDAEPHTVSPYLTAPYPSYVSLWSALYHHGMLDQIPREIYLVSLDRSKRIRTPLATFVVLHIAPGLFGGFEAYDRGARATPEKALFDTVYLGQAGGRRSTALPEIELPRGFKQQVVNRWVLRIRSKRLRTLVRRRLDRVLRAARSRA